MMHPHDIETCLRSFFPQLTRPPDAGYFTKHKRRFCDTLALLPPPTEGGSLLDVGIVPGHLATLAHAQGYKISGITHTETSDQLHSVAHQLAFDIRKADIEADPFPFENNTFDVVLFCEVLEHLYRNPFHTLSEIFRVLKPGGTLILTTPNLSCIEKLFGIARRYSYRKKISSPLNETFPPLIAHTHFREYTDRELIHMLRWQTKASYQFIPTNVHYSRCWQPSLPELARKIKHPLHFCASAAFWAASVCIPPLRSCIMIQAQKPHHSIWMPTDTWKNLHGLFDIERDEGGSPSRLPLPVPFRWTSPAARFALENPAPGQNSQCILRAGLLSPSLPKPLTTQFFVNQLPVSQHRFSPSTELTAISLPIPNSLKNSPTWDITIQTETWRPASFGLQDDRDLGIMLAWEPILCLPAASSALAPIEKIGARL